MRCTAAVVADHRPAARGGEVEGGLAAQDVSTGPANVDMIPIASSGVRRLTFQGCPAVLSPTRCDISVNGSRVRWMSMWAGARTNGYEHRHIALATTRSAMALPYAAGSPSNCHPAPGAHHPSGLLPNEPESADQWAIAAGTYQL